MSKWTVKGYKGSDYSIEGNDLITAIEENFSRIAKDNSIGNAAGYKLVKVTAKYTKGILGGKGGVELLISHKGQDLAHRPAPDEVKTSKVWIYAEEQIDHTFALYSISDLQEKVDNGEVLTEDEFDTYVKDAKFVEHLDKTIERDHEEYNVVLANDNSYVVKMKF